MLQLGLIQATIHVKLSSTGAHVVYVCWVQNGVETETLVPTGAYNIAFARTPAEVLAIVYLGSPSTPGGFFPNGVNGNIQG